MDDNTTYFSPSSNMFYIRQHMDGDKSLIADKIMEAIKSVKINNKFVVADGMAKAVWEDKYSRRKADGTFQTWEERIEEVVYGNYLINPYTSSLEDVKATTRLAKRGIMAFAGRHLQHGDADQPNKPLELFSNCSTSIFNFLNFLLLLNGSGVGADYSSYSRRVNYSIHMPHIRLVLDGGAYDTGDVASGAHPDFLAARSQFLGFFETLREAKHKYPTESEDVRWFKVEDSREGWARAIEIIETATWQQKHKDKLFIFDFSDVRASGEPIRGQQNRPASGPLPLMQAMAKMINIKGVPHMAPWKQALFIDHYLAACVALGGIRRSARIATKLWTDNDIFDFIEIKRGGHLWSANMSVLVDKQFWQDCKDPRTHAWRVFNSMTAAQYHDQTGEPGFINVDMLTQNDAGLEDITGDTFVVDNIKYSLHPKTREMLSNILGHIKRTKYKMIVNPCVTGDTVVKTEDGDKLVSELIDTPFMAVVDGESYRSEGFFSTGEKEVYTFTFVDENGNTFSPTLTLDHKVKIISDQLDEDGNIVYDFIEAQDLRPHHKVVGDDNIILGLNSIRYVGVKEVYDCTVEEVHQFVGDGVVLHNCGEIPLSVYGGVCIIGDLCLANADSEEELIEAAKYMAHFLIRVNMMSAVYNAEIKRTNRIGISLTGIHEYAAKVFGINFYDMVAYGSPEIAENRNVSPDNLLKAKAFWESIERIRLAAENAAYNFSRANMMNVPHTVTTIKPSGSISKILSCSEGAHLPPVAYYMRWVQFPKEISPGVPNPKLQEFKNNGYPTKDVSHQYNNVEVVGFPTKQKLADLLGDRIVTSGMATLEEQFIFLQLIEKYWFGSNQYINSNGQCSFTAKYYPAQYTWEKYTKVMQEYMPKVKCISVMPIFDTSAYSYQPEQEITREAYNLAVSNINAASREEYDDEVLNCASGICAVDISINK